MSLLFFGFVNAECVEYDGGHNIYEQSTINTDTAGDYDECWGVLYTTLSENYCEDGEMKHENIKCEHGCY